MSLLAIAYPELNKEDFELIQDFRKKYDKQFSIAAPHFTFVFPIEHIDIKTFTEETQKQLNGITSFSFCLRSAMVNKDFFTNEFLAFLIPREGHHEMIHLHDKLYSQAFLKYLRSDIPFIPHITVGHFADKITCQEKITEWNKNNFKIEGQITSVVIISYQDKKVKTLKKIKLVKGM